MVRQGGTEGMPDQQREEELRNGKGSGDVDDLIFRGDSQPNISDR